jgi:hypothetical protein
MKTLFCINILYLLTARYYAQDYYIKGTITDKKTSHYINKAKVSLYNNKDSLVTEVFSDRKGRYLLQANVHENYYILVDRNEYSVKKFVDIPIGKSIDKGDFTLDKKNGDSRSHFFSLSDYKAHHEYKNLQKKYALKIEDPKTVQKDGKTSWTAKTILTNNSRDTLFYFSTTDCEPSYYLIDSGVDSVQLYAEFNPCVVPKQTVIAIPPKVQRIVYLEIHSFQPVKSSFELKIYLSITKAKNMGERIPEDMLTGDKVRDILLVSNRIKMPTY